MFLPAARSVSSTTSSKSNQLFRLSSSSFIFFRSSKQVFLNFRARSRSLASATKVPRPTSYRMSQHLRGLITRWASSFVLIWLAWLSSLGPRNFHMTGLFNVVVLKGFCTVLKPKLTLKISSSVKPIPIISYNQSYFPPDFLLAYSWNRSVLQIRKSLTHSRLLEPYGPFSWSRHYLRQWFCRSVLKESQPGLFVMLRWEEF